jgi:hypothetical protein
MAANSPKKISFWTLIKRTFQLFSLLLLLRIFCFEMDWYQTYLKPITEPAWQSLFGFVEEKFEASFGNSENNTSENNSDSEEQKGSSDETSKNKKISNKNPEKLSVRIADAPNPCESKVEAVVYHQKWQNLGNQNFTGAYLLDTEEACNAHKNREELPEPTGTETAPYYGAVYKALAQYDQPKMQKVYEMFGKVRTQKKLNSAQFAEMVVTFIQNIPYVLVHPNTCQDVIKNGGFMAEYHQENKPCLANIRFGLASPSEFMYHQKGDCDTRALLAYLVLTHFGYDAAVLVSSTHSMLGLNVPSSGRYLTRKGKKYYFWETTNTGYALGIVAPNYQRDQWNFALVKPSK